MLSVSYAFIAAAATMLGGILVVLAHRWSSANRDYVLAFSAGILLSLSFLSIIPEVFPRNEWAPLVLLVGFLLMYLFEQFAVPHHVHEDEVTGHAHDLRSMTWMAWAGLLIHSLIDGLALASSAAVEDHDLLASVTFGVVLHEFPEGLVAAALIMAQGVSAARTLLLTALVALATPFGAAVASQTIDLLSHTVVQNTAELLMSLAAGTFIYVGAADMFHHSHSQRNHLAMLAFVLGIIVYSVLEYLAGH